LNKIKKVGILKGVSQYDVMRSWCLELEKGFAKLGIEVVVYDFINHKLELIARDIDCLIGFNGWFIEIRENIYFKDKPYIMILADHVIDHLGRINCIGDHDVLTVMDRYDANILAMLGYDKEVYFFPHAALELSYATVNKEIDCLFLGSFSDPSTYLKKLEKINSKLIVDKAKLVIEKCLNNSNLNYIEEFIDIVKATGINVSLTENTVIIDIIGIIGRYIYSKRRIEVLEAFERNNITIDVYGNGWENSSLYNKKNINFHLPVNFWESQELMKRAKVTLNIQSFLKDGSHERIYAGMSNDSISVTNKTIYLSEEFVEDEEIIFYDFDNLDAVMPKIKFILQDKVNREEITRKAKQKVALNHTYQSRASLIVNIVEDVINKKIIAIQ
jgi:hypothetical protein